MLFWMIFGSSFVLIPVLWPLAKKKERGEDLGRGDTA